MVWATLARMDKGGRLLRRIASLGLPEVAAFDRGHLNPAWVEWLMGFPQGWTCAEPLMERQTRKWADEMTERCLPAGAPNMRQRMLALGNAQVPAAAAAAWLLLSHPDY